MSKVRGKCCMVCSDRALGFNFNAITCESCKAFFRRNALADKKLTCPFSNNCEINAITRRFCQRCRLEKCFQVGMKKEFIMSEEDKELKRKKIEQNRNKRKLRGGDDNNPCKNSNDHEDAVQSKKSIIVREEWSPSPSIIADSTSSLELEESDLSDKYQNINSKSTIEQIVEAITETKNPTQIIQKIMQCQTETLDVMGRIIQSPQALVLISHLIKNPSDGMMIISKLLNSPLDALNVFSRFMSSPTDALQIIFKIISSPAEVLQFMTELSKHPNQGLEIMRRFMSTPSDILDSMLKVLMNSTQKPSQEEIGSKLDFSSAIDSPHSFNGSLYSPTTNYSEFEHCTMTDNSEQMFSEYQELKTIYSMGSSIDSIINKAIKLEYNTHTSTFTNSQSILNDAETKKIQELVDSNQALYDPVDEDLSFLPTIGTQSNTLESGVDPTLIKVINLTAVAIRRLIQMSKKISGFKKLCQEDQIALLKGGCTEMMILRSIMQYDSRSDVWKVPHITNTTGIKAEILKLCSKGNIYEEHEHFIKTFDPRLRTDEKVIMLLCAITLFSPERQYVVHSDVIKLEQSSYFFLLQRYLESNFSGCEAKSAYLQLLEKLQAVKKLNEDVISVYLDVNPTEVEPLLREIFDLKV